MHACKLAPLIPHAPPQPSHLAPRSRLSRSTALHGGMASSEKAARLGTHPLSSAVRPTVESDISGALHLLGWGLWTIMVGAIGLVVVTGSASLPWVTVDMLSVLALLFALLNMAIVKLSSSLALHARDRLILNMLPQEAAEVRMVMGGPSSDMRCTRLVQAE